MKKVSKQFAAFIIVVGLCLFLEPSNIYASVFNFEECGIKSLYLNDDQLVVITEKGIRNSELVDQDVLDELVEKFDSSGAILRAKQKDGDYEISILSSSDRRLLSNSMTQQQIEEFAESKEEIYMEDDPNANSSVVSGDYYQLIRSTFSYNDTDYLLYEDGVCTFVLFDYVKMSAKNREKILDRTVFEIEYSDAIMDGLTGESEGESESMDFYEPLYKTISIMEICIGILCVLCVAWVFVDLYRNTKITNSRIAFSGGTKEYSRIPIKIRTNRNLVWYYISIYFRYPLEMIFIVFLAIMAFGNNDVTIYLIKDTAISLLFICLYAIVLTKQRMGYYALILLTALETMTICLLLLMTNEPIGFVRLLLCILSFVLWMLPQLVYYHRRREIWLGEEQLISIRDLPKEAGTNGNKMNSYAFSNTEYTMDHTSEPQNLHSQQQVFPTGLSGFSVDSNGQKKSGSFVPSFSITDTPANAVDKNSPWSLEDTLADLSKDTGQLKDEQFNEIRKWKGLMDEGIITEEEFAAKKRDLLGL